MKNRNKFLTILALVVVSFLSYNFIHFIQDKPVKCLIQTKNYTGEGAYIVVSLMDPAGKYVKTLYVQGDDKEWYNTINKWWYNLGLSKTPNIDAISGATVTAGGRSVVSFQVPVDKIDKGYKIRFESAVEDQEYYEKDLEVALTTANLSGNFNGQGYIRFVRFLAK